jgi:hypothetical protein
MVNRYVDPVLGSDTFDGLYPEPMGGTQGPKKTIKSLYPFTKGDVLKLRSDRFHPSVTGYTYCTINVDNFKVEPYGTGAPPVIDGLYYEINTPENAATWVHEGDGVWGKKLGNATGTSHLPYRMWVGARNTGFNWGDRDPGVAMSRTPDATANTLVAITAALKANATDIWHPSNSTLGYKTYVYTGSTTVSPPEFYNGLAFLVSDGATIGAGSGVIVQHCRNVIVDSIGIWGGTGTPLLATSGTSSLIPTRDVTFVNCFSKYTLTGSGKVGPAGDNNTNPRTEISNILYFGCTGDAGSSAQEQEKTTAYGKISGFMDMFQFVDGVKNCLAYKCKAINSFHVGFVMGGTNLNSLWTDNCGFEECETFSDEWSTYNRACATYNTNPTCFIRNCIFDGQNVTSQFSGAATISGNIWKNMRLSPRKPDASGWIGISALFFTRGLTAMGNDRYVYMVPTGLKIVNNLVIDPYGVPINLETFNSDTGSTGLPEPYILPNTLTIANNIIYDRKNPKAYSVAVTERFTLIGKQNIHNNIFYRGEGQTAKYARINGSGQITLYDLNASPDCFDNLITDPLIDLTDVNNPVLMKTSPCRRAGAWVTHARDRKGRPFMIPPTIGPLEYAGKTPKPATV